MTKPFKNQGDDSEQFLIGDVKAIFFKTEIPTGYQGNWSMANKRKEFVEMDYNISTNVMAIRLPDGPYYYIKNKL